MTSGHWLVRAVERAGREVAGIELDPGATSSEAWAVLLRHGGLTPEELCQMVAKHYRLRVADLQASTPDARKLVPEALARRFGVLPLFQDDRTLTVAGSDPTDMQLEQDIAFASGRKVQLAVAAPSSIGDAVELAYGTATTAVEHAADELDAELQDAVQVMKEMTPEAVAESDVERGPVVKLTNLILRDAVRARASDVHIEPGRTLGAVRFRVDGVLQTFMELPMAALNRVVSRIKILGGLNIADRLRPQDGRTRIGVDGRQFDIRISTVPTRESEKAVLRLLDTESSIGLVELGVDGNDLQRLRGLLGHRDGIVAVTGPTGSGKTTTLYAALREVATGDVNIMTVEDPVEYELAGVTQIQVKPLQGVTFASALRAILRQDPDVILIGEIRDTETAGVAVQAAMTGHLVLGTLHTNDTASVVPRLADLGIDATAVGASLRGAVAQRLIRKLCTACAVPVNVPTPAEERLARVFGVAAAMRAVGCGACGGTGYRGRLPVQEIMVVTPAIADQIARGALLSELRAAAIKGGMRSLRDAAIAVAAAGHSTLDEVERVVGDMGQEVTPPSGAQRVLVVDDDAVNRALARTLLEALGLEVQEAADGEDAMRRLPAVAPHLMLLDLDMPRLDGRGVLSRVREDRATATLPVVVLTGSESVDTEAEIMERGADDYIRKPIDPARFVARVKAALRRAGV